MLEKNPVKAFRGRKTFDDRELLIVAVHDFFVVFHLHKIRRVFHSVRFQGLDDGVGLTQPTLAGDNRGGRRLIGHHRHEVTDEVESFVDAEFAGGGFARHRLLGSDPFERIFYAAATLGFRDEFPVEETKKFTGGLAKIDLHISLAHFFIYHATIISQPHLIVKAFLGLL